VKIPIQGWEFQKRDRNHHRREEAERVPGKTSNCQGILSSGRANVIISSQSSTSIKGILRKEEGGEGEAEEVRLCWCVCCLVLERRREEEGGEGGGRRVL
jgi:hypothetical protein